MNIVMQGPLDPDSIFCQTFKICEGFRDHTRHNHFYIPMPKNFQFLFQSYLGYFYIHLDQV
jgi:hypothetical protein